MPEASSVRKPLIDYCGRYKEATYRVIATQRGREIAIQRLFYLSFTALLCSLLAPAVGSQFSLTCHTLHRRPCRRTNEQSGKVECCRPGIRRRRRTCDRPRGCIPLWSCLLHSSRIFNKELDHIFFIFYIILFLYILDVVLLPEDTRQSRGHRFWPTIQLQNWSTSMSRTVPRNCFASSLKS